LGDCNINEKGQGIAKGFLGFRRTVVKRKNQSQDRETGGTDKEAAWDESHEEGFGDKSALFEGGRKPKSWGKRGHWA